MLETVSTPSSLQMLTASAETLCRMFLKFCFGTTSSNGQVILALHSEIMPGGAWGTNWDAGDWTWVSCVHGKHLICCTISLAYSYISDSKEL